MAIRVLFISQKSDLIVPINCLTHANSIQGNGILKQLCPQLSKKILQSGNDPD
jgi:hypothetical protein